MIKHEHISDYYDGDIKFDTVYTTMFQKKILEFNQLKDAFEGKINEEELYACTSSLASVGFITRVKGLDRKIRCRITPKGEDLFEKFRPDIVLELHNNSEKYKPNFPKSKQK